MSNRTIKLSAFLEKHLVRSWKVPRTRISHLMTETAIRRSSDASKSLILLNSLENVIIDKLKMNSLYTVHFNLLLQPNQVLKIVLAPQIQDNICLYYDIFSLFMQMFLLFLLPLLLILIKFLSESEHIAIIYRTICFSVALTFE